MDPLIERAADGANRDAPRRKAFIVINFTRIVQQAADKQRRGEKDAIQHTMKEQEEEGGDDGTGVGYWVFYSRVLRDSSSHRSSHHSRSRERKGKRKNSFRDLGPLEKNVTFFLPLARWPNLLLNAKSYEQASKRK